MSAVVVRKREGSRREGGVSFVTVALRARRGIVTFVCIVSIVVRKQLLASERCPNETRKATE